MEIIELNYEFKFPKELVWNLITDHENYKLYAPFEKTELVQVGEKEKNGVGAIRRFYSGELVLEEKITEFISNRSFKYLIIEVNLPAKHHGGEIQLSEEKGITYLNWKTEFEFDNGVDPISKRAIKGSFSKMFKLILSGINSILEKRET